MKKTTNKISICLLLLLSLVYSCKQKEKKEAPISNEELLKQVNEVLAIGKVIPADGWHDIALEEAGILQEILVKEGDSVQQGQVLARLRTGTETLDVRAAEAKLQNIKASNLQDLQDIKKEEIKLQQLQDKYEVSKRLLNKGAETRENTEADYANWKIQEQLIQGLRSKIQGNQALQNEQQVAIDKSAKSVSNLEIRALASGIITEWDAVLGQSLASNARLGQIANTRNLLIEAEVDELFADRIRLNQAVRITSIGSEQTLGSGTLVYLSPTLSNKSILFESANEAQDRRVRKIQVRPEDGQNLIINAKLECHIKIQEK